MVGEAGEVGPSPRLKWPNARRFLPARSSRQLGAAEVGCRRNKRSIQKRSTPGVTVGFIATIHRRDAWLESRPVTGIDLPICAAEAR